MLFCASSACCSPSSSSSSVSSSPSTSSRLRHRLSSVRRSSREQLPRFRSVAIGESCPAERRNGSAPALARTKATSLKFCMHDKCSAVRLSLPGTSTCALASRSDRATATWFPAAAACSAVYPRLSRWDRLAPSSSRRRTNISSPANAAADNSDSLKASAACAHPSESGGRFQAAQHASWCGSSVSRMRLSLTVSFASRAWHNRSAQSMATRCSRWSRSRSSAVELIGSSACSFHSGTCSGLGTCLMASSLNMACSTLASRATCVLSSSRAWMQTERR
mmetsp:Transcript_23994/g.39691  ORF Transcript_23994/g.39691 Transcript_23994/m.39691 type:complete len:278 (+) Transcript_23994:482-1315(+)